MSIEYTTKDIERFYAKVSKTPTERGCLEWTASRNAFGHGSFGVGKKIVYAHRFAWELVNGPIPAGLVIRHMCHNPLCCNPAHLEPGSRADNVQDMIDSGRFKNAPNTRAPYVGRTAAERFYAKVSKTPNETGCLDWLAGRNKAGYGRFGISGTHVLAHRFAWELVNGPIPAGMFACHKCDRPACCNPEHIFLGSMADNTRDMLDKGRGRNGERAGESIGTSKLTAEQIKEIRSPQYETWILNDIAARFGVSISAICSILNRRSWAHLDSSGDAPIQNRQPKGERNRLAKLTDADVLEIRSDKWAGKLHREIAEHFGVSRRLIGRVLSREMWAQVESNGDAPIRKYTPNKLTDAQVLSIRSEDFAGWKQQDIAAHFGVSFGLISNILHRKARTRI